MDNFKDYISYKFTSLHQYSDQTYANYISQSSVLFSFDYGSLLCEVCFARLFHQMDTKTFSSNYLMRLPYSKEDKKMELHTKYMDYPKFFENIANLVESVYKLTVHVTPFANIKLITFENKLELSKSLDYCLTLILFTMIRGVEGEYNTKLRDTRAIFSGDLREYIYSISKISRGSHHNINDVLDSIIQSNDNSIENLKKLVSSKYIDTLEKTFSKNGLINNEKYQSTFDKIFVSRPDGYGYAMQTKAFDFIQKTTNKILLEE